MRSQDCSDFESKKTVPVEFQSEPDVPIQPEPVAYPGIATYIEPHLTVRAQWDQTNNAVQEPLAPSSRSPGTEMDGQKSSTSSPVPSPPTVEPGTVLAPLSMAGLSTRKRVLSACPYCHKSFSPSELK
jgi:hypothetical protein